MLISNAKSLYVKQSITFTFKEDIDKVFNCFFNPKILTKLGFFNNKITKEHFPLKKVKFEYKNSSNTIELDPTEEIEKSDMKIVKRQIKKIRQYNQIQFERIYNAKGSNHTKVDSFIRRKE